MAEASNNLKITDVVDADVEMELLKASLPKPANKGSFILANPLDNLGVTNAGVTTDFVKRDQEITTLLKREASLTLISPYEKAKYSFELSNLHCYGIDKISAALHTDPSRGLSQSEAAQKLLKEGPNVIPKNKERHVLLKLLVCILTNGFNPLLWFCSVFLFIAWQPLNGGVANLIAAVLLIIIILVNSVLIFFQDIQSSNVLKSFDSLIPTDCITVRDNRQITISSLDLVVGDVIVLESGNRIPADLRVLSCNGIKVDKSMLTGENEPAKLTSNPSEKTISMLSSPNMAFMGCNIVEGYGTGIVVSTGKNTQLAKIVSGITSINVRKSPLEVEIVDFVFKIGLLAILSTIVVCIVWATYLNVQHNGFMSVSSMIANAISVLIAYVPEGLPMALSMGLTIIAARLCRDHNVLVKNLSLVEGLGSMSFVATDKTGTLTQNLMTVSKLFSNGMITSLDEKKQTNLFSDILAASFFCNQSKLESSHSGFKAIGSNGIDRALLEFVNDQTSIKTLSTKYTNAASIPFSSSSKIATVVIVSTLTVRVIIKGAPEFVLERCASFYEDDGTIKDIDPDFLRDVYANIVKSASQGERIIAIAQIDLQRNQYASNFIFETDPPNFPMDKLVFVTCVSVSDPPRDGVKEAVEKLRHAGIRISMVTGDATLTAVNIAHRVGIISSNSDGTIVNVHRYKDFVSKNNFNIVIGDGINDSSSAVVVEGKEIIDINPKGWDYIFSHNEIVFARVSPEDKMNIVKQAQSRNYVVGVTGDGVNDSPALKQADVGIAMNSGSDVARSTADIVLLTDDFNALPEGVLEGRLIFSNLRKVIGYQIAAGCYSELLPVLATFFFGMPQPLSSILMLIISCMTDAVNGVALITEPPESSLMDEKPRDSKKTKLVEWSLIIYAYMFYGNMESVGAFATFFHFMSSRGPIFPQSSIPPNDPGNVTFPAGYTPSQLINDWNWLSGSDDLFNDENEASNTGSSIFFLALVVSQIFHMLSIRRKTPYFSDAIMNTGNSKNSVGRRLWIELAESKPRWQLVCSSLFSVCTILFFTEITFFQNSIGTNSIPPVYWGITTGFAVGCFIIGEIRKWIVILFPKSFVAKLQW